MRIFCEKLLSSVSYDRYRHITTWYVAIHRYGVSLHFNHQTTSPLLDDLSANLEPPVLILNRTDLKDERRRNRGPLAESSGGPSLFQYNVIQQGRASRHVSLMGKRNLDGCRVTAGEGSAAASRDSLTFNAFVVRIHLETSESSGGSKLLHGSVAFFVAEAALEGISGKWCHCWLPGREKPRQSALTS